MNIKGGASVSWYCSLGVCILSFLSVFTSISLSAFNPMLGGLFTFTLLLVLILSGFRLYILCFLIFFLLFKNIFISISIDLINAPQVFRLLLGLDFIIWSFCLLFVVIKFNVLKHLDKTILLLIVILVFYFILGVISNGLIASATYLRTLSMPLIIYLVISSYSTNERFLKFLVKFIVAIASLLLLYEVLFTLNYYDSLGISDFFTLKSSDRSYESVELIKSHTRKLFNYFSILQIYRPIGFSHQPISVGYVLALSGCYLFSRKNYGFSLLCLLCILLLGSKGPLILLLFSTSFYVFNISSKVTFSCLVLLLSLIVAMGLKNFDPHVYSVLSSFIALPTNFLGQGLGFGGVITSGTSYSTDFESISGDSGLAVCLNMMGIIGFVFFFKIYGFFIMQSKKLALINPANKIFYYSSCCLIINGVIQEEALSAYSIGFLSLILGFLSNRAKKVNT